MTEQPEIKAGELYILDKDFNNSSTVKVLTVSKLFAEIYDPLSNNPEKNAWTVMKYRLSPISSPKE